MFSNSFNPKSTGSSVSSSFSIPTNRKQQPINLRKDIPTKSKFNYGSKKISFNVKNRSEY